MKRLIWFVIPAILCISCTTARRISVLEIPEIKPTTLSPEAMTEYESKYGKYDGVYLNYETIVEHSGTKEEQFINIPDWKYSYITRKTYLIFNPEADWLTGVRLWTKPDNVYVHVKYPDGSTAALTKTDFSKEGDKDGGQFYTAIIPNIKRGTIVDLGWDVSYPGYYSGRIEDVPLQFSIPCERLVFEYLYPQWWSISERKVAANNLLNLQYHSDVNAELHKRKLHYELDSIPPLQEELYSPRFREAAGFVQLKINNMEMQGRSQEFDNTWSEVAEGYRKFAMKKISKGNPDFKDEIKRLTEGAMTAYDSVYAITRFVRDEFNLDEHREGYAKQILQKKNGSSMDLVVLTKALLEAAGFRSNCVVIHAASDGIFDDEFVAYDQLYSPALIVWLQESAYVLFPQTRRLPIGTIPSQYLGQQALYIDTDIGSFCTIPEQSTIANRLTDSAVVTVSEDGRISTEQVLNVTGTIAYVLRNELSEVAGNERDQFIAKHLCGLSNEVQIDSVDIIALEDVDLPLRLFLRYSGNLMTITPEEKILRADNLFPPVIYNHYDAKPEERVNPVRISYDASFDRTIVINYPENWQVESEMLPGIKENELGSCTIGFQTDSGKLTVDQSLRLKRSWKDKSAITDLIDLISIDNGLHVPTLVFGERIELGALE